MSAGMHVKVLLAERSPSLG